MDQPTKSSTRFLYLHIEYLDDDHIQSEKEKHKGQSLTLVGTYGKKDIKHGLYFYGRTDHLIDRFCAIQIEEGYSIRLNFYMEILRHGKWPILKLLFTSCLEWSDIREKIKYAEDRPFRMKGIMANCLNQEEEESNVKKEDLFSIIKFSKMKKGQWSIDTVISFIPKEVWNTQVGYEISMYNMTHSKDKTKFLL